VIPLELQVTMVSRTCSCYTWEGYYCIIWRCRIYGRKKVDKLGEWV